MTKYQGHTFHIPVMGTGFSIDTPLKVAPYGISSAISIGDDALLEKMREFYCQKFDLPYQSITKMTVDYRAKRITSYLNLIDQLARKKFAELKNIFSTKNEEFKKYLEMMPDFVELKHRFNHIVAESNLAQIQKWVNEHFRMGDIDVNVMTKVDRANYHKNKKLAIEFNDAHASIRGFAVSNLSSSVILSAGLNPRLYSYLSNFEDFYLNKNGEFKKKIILKVSDYRSALIQGKFLAKKGLWVSEYRIESGLNCGGHAFPTDGFLMGPILEIFKNRKSDLVHDIFKIYTEALKGGNLLIPSSPPSVRITAQGGVGTSEEHHFLIRYYGLDSVGWGSPFLLVPEVTNVDAETLNLLRGASEKDLYLSNISPLGIRFHSLRENSKELERQALQVKGKPGSPCPKKFLALNTEFSDKGLCTASRKYQNLKIKELDRKNLDRDEYNKAYSQIVEKTCICVGLGTAALVVNDLDTKVEKKAVSVCPGPNLAYFSEVVTLRQMVDHIYGRNDIMKKHNRPHFFIKEFYLYIDFLKEKLIELRTCHVDKQLRYIDDLRSNLDDALLYYTELFSGLKAEVDVKWNGILSDLVEIKSELEEVRF